MSLDPVGNIRLRVTPCVAPPLPLTLYKTEEFAFAAVF